MPEFFRLTAQEVGDAWPAIEQWVEDSLLDDITVRPDDIRKLCETGQAELWIVHKQDVRVGFLVGWSMQNFRARCYYASWFGGREVQEWIREAYEKLKVHAREVGCVQLILLGRKAWQKLFGLKPKAVYYCIKL